MLSTLKVRAAYDSVNNILHDVFDMSSSKSASWKRFPIGELAKKRKALSEEYMAAESETVRLQDEVNIAQRDVNKLKKGILYQLGYGKFKFERVSFFNAHCVIGLYILVALKLRHYYLY